MRTEKKQAQKMSCGDKNVFFFLETGAISTGVKYPSHVMRMI